MLDNKQALKSGKWLNKFMVNSYECPKCGKTSGYSMNLKTMLDDGTLAWLKENIDIK